MSGSPTITEQADEVEREVRQRERLYPRWIDETDRAGRPRITEATAERKLAAMRAAARTLRFVESHAVGLRALVHFLLASAPGEASVPTADERQALLGHPAVRAVLEAWPGAALDDTAPPAPEGPVVRDLFASLETD